MSQQLSMIALLGTVSLAAACSSDSGAAGTGGGGSDQPATAEGGMMTADAARTNGTDGAAADSAAVDSGADSAVVDSGADSAPAMTARACDDNLKALDVGVGATVTLVKSFKMGDALALVTPAPADAPLARAEVCLVKIIVGPGNPGPVDAPSTSVGIGIEVWLPAHASWNERYQAFGGAAQEGGPATTSLTAIGSVHPSDPVGSAMSGFVVSTTDGGHSSTGAFAMNPDGSFNKTLFSDYAERAAHEMTLKSKMLLKAFYGRDAKYSYWNGCSTGGREGIMEVERHPEDFDGVLAGSPALNANIASLWAQVVMQQDLGGPIAGDKLAAVTTAANAACDSALTGQPDGYVSDPSACKYDPTTDTSLLCASAGGTNSAASCLTPAEAIAMNKIWYGPTLDGTVPPPPLDNGNSPVGALAANQLWFGLERGSRPAGNPIWDGVAGKNLASAAQVALALGDPAFAPPSFVNATGNGQNKWKTIGYTTSPSFAEVFAAWQKLTDDIIGTSNADVTAFRDHSGKLLMWHGTADSVVFPQGSIKFYEAVSARLGGYTEAQKFARFYLAPGIDHCAFAGVTGSNPPAPGGHLEYTNNGLIELLQRWVEHGEAPEHIAATSAPGVTPNRSRPWCLYPKKLKYVSGDVNTGNFTCE